MQLSSRFEVLFMPTMEVSKKDLEGLVGRKINDNILEESLLSAKIELEGRKGDVLKLDCKDTNRPDLWSAEGVARVLKGHFELDLGVPKYNVLKSKHLLRVDKSISNIRPFMVACVAKSLKLDKESISQNIQLQEKISLTYGRRRRDAAIGVFDLSKIKGPFTYKAVSDDEIKFVPLGFGKEMHPSQILKEHQKGKEYGHLIRGNKFPVLLDSNGQVCSMPPVINSELTGKVTEKTKSVLVEVSGYDLDHIRLALNVMAAALADRGAKLEGVASVFPGGKKVYSPDFRTQSAYVNADNARRFLGLPLSNEEISHLLSRSRFDVNSRGKDIKAEYLNYRNDVTHERDLIEDIAIAFGYNEMEPEPPRIFTIGKGDENEGFSDSLKEVMLGMEFQEILTFILTSRNNLFDKMLTKGESCEIANPVSENWGSLRTWLTPNTLEFLSKNMHAEYPQKVFEIGNCFLLDGKAETKTRDVKKLGAAISDVRIGYENASSVLHSFMESLGIKFSLKDKKYPFLIEGRSADIVVKGKPAGFIGEVHPKVLKNWGLQKAAVVFEMDVSLLK